MFYLWYLIGFLFVHQNNNNDNSIDGQEYFWSLEKFSISFFFSVLSLQLTLISDTVRFLMRQEKKVSVI